MMYNITSYNQLFPLLIIYNCPVPLPFTLYLCHQLKGDFPYEKKMYRFPDNTGKNPGRKPLILQGLRQDRQDLVAYGLRK